MKGVSVIIKTPRWSSSRNHLTKFLLQHGILQLLLFRGSVFVQHFWLWIALLWQPRQTWRSLSREFCSLLQLFEPWEATHISESLLGYRQLWQFERWVSIGRRYSQERKGTSSSNRDQTEESCSSSTTTYCEETKAIWTSKTNGNWILVWGSYDTEEHLEKAKQPSEKRSLPKKVKSV